jgi:hypothetical protein
MLLGDKPASGFIFIVPSYGQFLYLLILLQTIGLCHQHIPPTIYAPRQGGGGAKGNPSAMWNWI